MRQHGPWKIKSSEVKYKNPWMEVREDQVIQPDGKNSVYGVLRAHNGASVLPFTADGKVVLVKDFKFALGADSLEVVSGGIEKGESVLDAAKRELQEEAGLIAKEWVSLGVVNPFTSFVEADAHLFIAKDLTQVGVDRDGAEQGMEVVTLPFAEAVQMVMDSKITHAQSCVLILKAAKYLGKL